VWDGFTLSLYAEVFATAKIKEAFLNTIIVALVSSLLATVIGTVSAIGIYYLKKTVKAAALGLNQIPVINADIITGIACMLFFLMVKIPLGYITLIIAHTVITIPYVVLAVLPRLGQLNPNLYEAGLDLGAGPVKTLARVILPQLIPAMISGFAMAFTLSLDDFVVTKFNSGGEINTISTYLYNALAKRDIRPVMRAFSSILFLGSLAVLILVNIYSKRKAKRNALLMK
jgi:spermidine/putrescine transport system permease protein